MGAVANARMKTLIAVLVLALAGGGWCRDEEDGRLLVAAYTTRTDTTVSSTTVTVLYTCGLTYNAVACSGRRRRRRTPLAMEGQLKEDWEAGGGLLLDSGLNPVEEFQSDQAGSNREGRIALTVWTTSSTTFTFTSTSTNSATTVSLSYYCSFANAAVIPACG